MIGSRVGDRVALGLMKRAAIASTTALALAGCSAADALKLPGMSKSASPLNVTERPDVPPREVTPDEAKSARAKLTEAATLAAARSNPRDVESAVAAARILRRQGDKPGALALLDQAASASPNDARLARDRGLLALELGAVPRARDHLQQALTNGSRDWQTHSALGTALAASGQQKAAQQQFAEALKQAPDNPVVLNNLALSLALDGRRGEAEQMLRRAASGQKASDARVAQNLALVSKISAKPAISDGNPRASEVPVSRKADRKAAAPSAVRTAYAE